MAVTWLTACLDTPAAVAPQVEAFWAGVTGWSLSPRRGAGSALATLLPPDGDAVLRTQVVGAPPPGALHLDVHTDDVRQGSARATGLGASLVGAMDEGYVGHRSPGGLPFCVVSPPEGRRPGPASWPGGRSRLDQVCLDVPSPGFDAEADFWAQLLGWTRQAGSRSGFERLLPPAEASLHVLLQRLDDVDGPARAHLDLAADDVAAEVRRHVALGAPVVRVEPHWTTLADPAGRHYCVTGRDPGTGRLP